MQPIYVRQPVMLNYYGSHSIDTLLDCRDLAVFNRERSRKARVGLRRQRNRLQIEEYVGGQIECED